MHHIFQAPGSLSSKVACTQPHSCTCNQRRPTRGIIEFASFFSWWREDSSGLDSHQLWVIPQWFGASPVLKLHPATSIATGLFNPHPSLYVRENTPYLRLAYSSNDVSIALADHQRNGCPLTIKCCTPNLRSTAILPIKTSGYPLKPPPPKKSSSPSYAFTPNPSTWHSNTRAISGFAEHWVREVDMHQLIFAPNTALDRHGVLLQHFPQHGPHRHRAVREALHQQPNTWAQEHITGACVPSPDARGFVPLAYEEALKSHPLLPSPSWTMSHPLRSSPYARGPLRFALLRTPPLLVQATLRSQTNTVPTPPQTRRSLGNARPACGGQNYQQYNCTWEPPRAINSTAQQQHCAEVELKSLIHCGSAPLCLSRCRTMRPLSDRGSELSCRRPTPPA